MGRHMMVGMVMAVVVPTVAQLPPRHLVRGPPVIVPSSVILRRMMVLLLMVVVSLIVDRRRPLRFPATQRRFNHTVVSPIHCGLMSM